MKDIIKKLTDIEATAPKTSKKKILTEDSSVPPVNVSDKPATFKDMFEAIAGMKPIPVVGKEGSSQQTGAGFVNVTDPSLQGLGKTLGDLAQQKKVQIVVPTTTQQSGQNTPTTQQNTQSTQSNQGTAMGTNQQQVKEKWGEETKVAPSEKGKYAGLTKDELTKRYNALKKTGPHKKGSAAYGKMRELSFAIRAKSDWGKVQEEHLGEDEKLNKMFGLSSSGTVVPSDDNFSMIYKKVKQDILSSGVHTDDIGTDIMHTLEDIGVEPTDELIEKIHTKLVADGVEDKLYRDFYESKKIDEIGDTERGRKALASYTKKAAPQILGKAFSGGAASARNNDDKSAALTNKAAKRMAGVMRAADRLVKEEQIDEKLTKSMSAGDIISDFEKSKDPKFKGLADEPNKTTAVQGKKLKEAERTFQSQVTPLEKLIQDYGYFISTGTVHLEKNGETPEAQQKLLALVQRLQKDAKTFVGLDKTKMEANRDTILNHIHQMMQYAIPILKQYLPAEKWEAKRGQINSVLTAYNNARQINEKLTKSMSAGDIISDFEKSKDPKFKGKSKEQRKKQALGAYYSMHPEKSKKKVKEADIPSTQGIDTMGAGLGAGRSKTTLEAKEPQVEVIDNAFNRENYKDLIGKKYPKSKAPAYARVKEISEGAKPDFLDLDKDGNKKEPMKKAAADKKKKQKVKESMNHRISAARLEGKSHGLRGHAHSGKRYEDLEELKAYHEGYKEGLDECYGQGVYETAPAMPAATVGGMADDAMEDSMLDELSRGDYLKQQARRPGDTFKAFGQTFHDRDVLENDFTFESWDKQLKSLVEGKELANEGLSVSVSKGQQNSPDSVTITAQDAEADQLLQLVKHAGLGLFGDDQKEPSSATSVQPANGIPAEVGAANSDIEVVDGSDDMLSIMKKIGGIQGSSDDYEEENVEKVDEVSQELLGRAASRATSVANYADPIAKRLKNTNDPQRHKFADLAKKSIRQRDKFTSAAGLDPEEVQSNAPVYNWEKEKVRYDEETEEDKCNECGMYESECDCSHDKEQVDEVESEEEMEFNVSEETDSQADEEAEAEEDAALAGADSDDEKEVNESFFEMLQRLDRLAEGSGDKPKHPEHDKKDDKDFDDAEEDEEDEEDVTEGLNEWANQTGKGPGKGTDASFERDIEFMTKVIAGGLNKPKSTGQTTVPVIAGQDDRMHDNPKDWATLAGIKKV